VNAELEVNRKERSVFSQRKGEREEFYLRALCASFALVTGLAEVLCV
jgi:hypothetical protein